MFGGGSSGRVAGVEVTEGAVAKGAQADVRRGKEVVATGVTVNSIRRFKDLVEQVEAGTGEWWWGGGGGGGEWMRVIVVGMQCSVTQ